MDAFSVSIVNGLKESKMRFRKMLVTAATFAVFQAVMPLTGWLCVHTVVKRFKMFEGIVPWISLALLLYIGIKMLAEGIRSRKYGVQVDSEINSATLFVQGVATSLDALSVGFAIAEYGFTMALVCSLIIAGVTFFICLAGVKIGKKVGMGISGKADIAGGIILILIGIEIFIRHI